MEEIFKKFESKKAEITQGEEIELSLEKQKEILREAISEHMGSAQPIPSAQQQAIIQKASQIKVEPKERQIELLIDLTFEKGIMEAVEIAKKLDSPYLLDEFHDTLIDKLYNKLVAEKKLEQI